MSTHVMPIMKMKVRSSFCGVPVFRCQSMGIGLIQVSAPLRFEQLRITTHQDQERKICSSVDGANDHQEQLDFDAAAGVRSREVASKGGPEG